MWTESRARLGASRDEHVRLHKGMLKPVKVFFQAGARKGRSLTAAGSVGRRVHTLLINSLTSKRACPPRPRPPPQRLETMMKCMCMCFNTMCSIYSSWTAADVIIRCLQLLRVYVLRSALPVYINCGFLTPASPNISPTKPPNEKIGVFITD